MSPVVGHIELIAAVEQAHLFFVELAKMFAVVGQIPVNYIELEMIANAEQVRLFAFSEQFGVIFLVIIAAVEQIDIFVELAEQIEVLEKI